MMDMHLGYHTVRNVSVGFAIGAVLCIVALAIEAAFTTQEVAMLF